MPKNIAVYCGSRFGKDPNWKDLAYQLGQGIAHRGWGLIFGGGSRGLMGQVSEGVFQSQGRVVGVIPENLLSERPNQEKLTELHFVKTMGERKQLMAEFSDAFVILPGGIGTLDEFFDIWANAQIGNHQKAIILANWSGYYDPLMQFIQHCHENGFVMDSHFEKIQIVSNLEGIFHSLEGGFSKQPIE